MGKTRSLFVTKDRNLFINLEDISSAEWDKVPGQGSFLLVRERNYTHRLGGDEGQRLIDALEDFHENLWVEKETKTFE